MPLNYLLLGVALAPYLALVSIDAWMHEASRQVPRIERWLHYSAAALFLGFLVALFRDATALALPLFGAFAAVTAWDAVGFHRHLDARERAYISRRTSRSRCSSSSGAGWSVPLERLRPAFRLCRDGAAGFRADVRVSAHAALSATRATGGVTTPCRRSPRSARCSAPSSRCCSVMRSGRCDEFHDWGALLGGGRSIAGALLFGFLGVEAAKPLLRYDIPPNDRFAIVLPFSIGARTHWLPDRRLLSRRALGRPVGHHLCRRHPAAPGAGVRDAVPLGDGLPVDSALAPTNSLRAAVRALSSELRCISFPHRVPARNAQGLRRPVGVPDHEPADDRRRAASRSSRAPCVSRHPGSAGKLPATANR